ncbi:hypothetical protein RBG61_12610 [Paludicola sp. MB14-C6]|uniref:DUF6873 family GME fold protein n=1 Tax=Paludihabitans sp. MB14-C6 TaxID=3070656 RepID=UPI0027DDBCD0|nr:hypothetical protein [Paludicola sp. MB14-C6]WMJ22822.1 hypothetical protein RBG61_12610 [Paludicola sp. MB14-C6]
MGFVKNANLPHSNVTYCVVSGQYQSVLEDLKAMNIIPLIVTPCYDVQTPISCHADIICYHLGGSRIILYPYTKELTCQLAKLGFQVIHTNNRLQPKYPYDIALNAVSIGKWVISNFEYTDSNISNEIPQENKVNTKQGYAKCSTLVVNENAIITSDSNIKAVAERMGIEVLLIQPGHIRLDGYDYGFIGGCGFKTNKNTMYFTGDSKTHPDYYSIKQFLEERDITIINGTGKELIDVGSILPIKEKSGEI